MDEINLLEKAKKIYDTAIAAGDEEDMVKYFEITQQEDDLLSEHGANICHALLEAIEDIEEKHELCVSIIEKSPSESAAFYSAKSCGLAQSLSILLKYLGAE